MITQAGRVRQRHSNKRCEGKCEGQRFKRAPTRGGKPRPEKRTPETVEIGGTREGGEIGCARAPPPGSGFRGRDAAGVLSPPRRTGSEGSGPALARPEGRKRDR